MKNGQIRNSNSNSNAYVVHRLKISTVSQRLHLVVRGMHVGHNVEGEDEVTSGERRALPKRMLHSARQVH